MTLTRDFYIPKGAIKIADKQSAAVVYIYATKDGKPCGRLFYGKQAKPTWSYRFRNEKERALEIAKSFNHYRAIEERKAAESAKRKAFVNPYKVGDLFKRSWGYDQTNVDYYEVVAVSGKMVTVRTIAQKSVETGFMSGKTTPLPGTYTGEPKRCLAQDGHIKINHHDWAHYVKPDMVAGVPVYGTDYYSSYA